MHYTTCCCLIALLLAVAGSVDADEPPMEKRVLADGEFYSRWSTAEATMRPDAAPQSDGRALRFHVDVNHETGQPDYPIGWPRTYLTLPEDARDWHDWDFVEFRVYTDTSRDKLPNTPLGFIVRSPDRSNSYHRTVDEASKGEWARVRVSTSEMPDPGQCTAVQFFIAESNYNHGDVLDFWIDDLALLRYAEPTIVNMRPQGHVHYNDTAVIRIDIEMSGLMEGQTAELRLGLVRDGDPVCDRTVAVRSGRQSIPLELGGDLRAGLYEIQARIAGSQRAVRETIRIVASPWDEES